MPETRKTDRTFAFPRRMRVRNKRDFERLLRGGMRLSNGFLAVWALPNELRHCRLGLLVTRRHGNAVARNRLKRLIREAFRLSQHDLPMGLDLLVSPRIGVVLRLTTCRQAIQDLANQLARRLARRPRGAPPRHREGEEKA